jgi:hypothetical protein
MKIKLERKTKEKHTWALQSPGTLLLLAVQTPWENTAKSTGRWVLVDLPLTIVVDVPGRPARW